MILVKSELKTPCYQPPRIKTVMLHLGNSLLQSSGNIDDGRDGEEDED